MKLETCKICNGDLATSPDKLVLCEFQDGFTHLGCCANKCSKEKKPCIHCKSIYGKTAL